MKESFSFEHGINLLFESEVIDLHNHCGFLGFSYLVDKRILRIDWDHFQIVDNTRVKGLFSMIYEGVEKLLVLPRDSEMPFEVDDMLIAVGYFCECGLPDSGVLSATSRGVFQPLAEKEDNWLRAFEFHSESILAVRAQTGKIVMGANKPALDNSLSRPDFDHE